MKKSWMVFAGEQWDIRRRAQWAVDVDQRLRSSAAFGSHSEEEGMALHL